MEALGRAAKTVCSRRDHTMKHLDFTMAALPVEQWTRRLSTQAPASPLGCTPSATPIICPISIFISQSPCICHLTIWLEVVLDASKVVPWWPSLSSPSGLSQQQRKLKPVLNQAQRRVITHSKTGERSKPFVCGKPNGRRSFEPEPRWRRILPPPNIGTQSVKAKAQDQPQDARASGLSSSRPVQEHTADPCLIGGRCRASRA